MGCRRKGCGSIGNWEALVDFDWGFAWGNGNAHCLSWRSGSEHGVASWAKEEFAGVVGLMPKGAAY